MPEVDDETRKIFAEASLLSYNDFTIQGSSEALTNLNNLGWEQVDINKDGTIDNGDYYTSTSGFSGVAYKNANGEIVIAYTGTNNLPDWVPNDIGIALDLVPEEYQEALAFYNMIQHDYQGAKITVTGHSLGGALAQLVGAATGADAVTFNSPGVAHLLNDLNLSTSDEYSNITNYSLGNDILNTLNIAGGFKKIGSNYIIPSTGKAPIAAHNDFEHLKNNIAIPQNEWEKRNEKACELLKGLGLPVAINLACRGAINDLLHLDGVQSYYLNKGKDILQVAASLFMQATNTIRIRIDPLLVDLDGDGIETTALNNGVYFDHDKNGYAQNSARVGSLKLVAWFWAVNFLRIFDKYYILKYENSFGRNRSVKKNIIEEYIKNGQNKLAVENYEQSADLSSFSSDIHNEIGKIYVNNEEYELAIDCFERAIKLSNQYYKGYNNIGICYKYLEKTKSAIDSYKKAIDIKPDFSAAYNNLATIYMENKKYDLAITHYKKALDLNPNDEMTYKYLGICYQNTYDYKLALESYLKSQSLKENKYDVELYQNMGICSLKLKDYELALEYFGKALIIAPDNAYILNNIGIVYSCKKEHDIAINYFKKALNLKNSFLFNKNLIREYCGKYLLFLFLILLIDIICIFLVNKNEILFYMRHLINKFN